MNLRHQAEINLIKSGKHPTTSSKMDNINITLPGVEKLLKDLNPNKASGPDEISPRLMKELHHEIAPYLTKIFCASLDTGSVPLDWRSAQVAPIFKKGAKCKACN